MRFSHEPKGTSLRILADSEVVSGMNYGAVKLDDSLKSARHVIHNEIRQRECVARPGPAFMNTNLGRIGTSLPTLSFATFASIELNVQHTSPESEGAFRVVGWKLDEGDGRAIHAPTIAALDEVLGNLGCSRHEAKAPRELGGRFRPRQEVVNDPRAQDTQIISLDSSAPGGGAQHGCCLTTLTATLSPCQ
jgi:hypothetical protein